MTTRRRKPTALEQRITALSHEADKLWLLANAAELAGYGLDAGRLQRGYDQIGEVIASLRLLNDRIKARANLEVCS